MKATIKERLYETKISKLLSRQDMKSTTISTYSQEPDGEIYMTLTRTNKAKVILGAMILLWIVTAITSNLYNALSDYTFSYVASGGDFMDIAEPMWFVRDIRDLVNKLALVLTALYGLFMSFPTKVIAKLKKHGKLSQVTHKCTLKGYFIVGEVEQLHDIIDFCDTEYRKEVVKKLRES